MNVTRKGARDRMAQRRSAAAPEENPDGVCDASSSGEANALIRELRRAAKRRRRLFAWAASLVATGLVATVMVFSRVDLRFSLAIFGVTAAIVALGLTREAYRWERNAERAARLRDIRAVGPLLTVLNDRDSSACGAIEETLIELLPQVERMSQLSRNARRELNRLLLQFEMPGLRGGHNAELARIALELVDRLQDCTALPAVRRLAVGFTATRPSAAIRDLATDMLPDLEQRAVLLRASGLGLDADRTYLRPVRAGGKPGPAEHLVRPSSRRCRSYCAVQPPSIVSDAPVINAEAAEQR